MIFFTWLRYLFTNKGTKVGSTIEFIPLSRYIEITISDITPECPSIRPYVYTKFLIGHGANLGSYIT